MKSIRWILQNLGFPDKANIPDKFIHERICPACGKKDLVDHIPEEYECCSNKDCQEFIEDYQGEMHF